MKQHYSIKTTSRAALTSAVPWRACQLLLTILLFLALPVTSLQAAPAGYATYFIPGDTANMFTVFSRAAPSTPNDNNLKTSPMYSSIGVTSWADNTQVYIDHWEDGYDYDPADPVNTADEACPTQNQGDILSLISEDVPYLNGERPNFGSPCNITGAGICQLNGSNTANGCYYDGRDKIYVVGGSTTVTRISMPQNLFDFYIPGLVQAVAWEVYPVRPQLTTYILPFGEDLATGTAPNTMMDFTQVNVLVQATADNTVVQADFDNNGSYDQIWDGTSCNNSITLAEGEVLLLTSDSDNSTNCTSPGVGIQTGMHIEGSDTLQVQYVVAAPTKYYEIRGFSAFPRGFWDNEYYAPVDDDGVSNGTDIYLHNPNSSAITIDWQSNTGSGNYIINPGETASFIDTTGSRLPTNTSSYFMSRGGEPFWGVSTVDTEGLDFDWGYSLVPAYLLADHYFIGIAPGHIPVDATNFPDENGIYIAPAQDNCRVFVDFDGDGTRVSEYSLNRLDTQYVFDAVDGAMTGASIYGTCPFTLSYGQNARNTTAGDGIDLGYTSLPTAGNWVDLVLQVEKAVDPVMIPAATVNQVTKYTITVNTQEFDVNNIIINDLLAADWDYCDTTTSGPTCFNPIVTFPDGSTSNDTPGVATVNGRQEVTWDATSFTGGQLDMNSNQQLVIEYWAYTTAATYVDGDISTTPVEAIGSRTVGGVIQTFTAMDQVFNLYTNSLLNITKTSIINGDSSIQAAAPGDTITYTVQVTNPHATLNLTNIALYDPIPAGTTYVAASSQLTMPGPVISPAGDPPGFIRASENRTLTAGQSLTLTFNVTVNDPFPAGQTEIVNTAEATSTEIPVPQAASVTDPVVLPTTTGAQVGDRIWLDSNGNGVFDPGESGLAGIRVILRDKFGTPLLETLTDSNGLYVFNAVPDSGGDTAYYYVAVDSTTLPTGLVQTTDSRTDNRTNSFGLTDGQTYLDADIGYQPTPGTASFGDYVWSDADNDDVQDSGEVGLGGITVGLWLDTNGNRIFESGVDTLVQQTVTASDGSYLFTGAAAGNGENYFVAVLDTQAALTGWTKSASTGIQSGNYYLYSYFNIADGAVHRDADFGFYNVASTWSITDKVWYDANGNGQDNGDGNTEAGLAGVTVVLRDDGGNIVATTSSASTGEFVFTGVPADIRYTIEITDTNNVLAGYYPTTQGATDRSWQMAGPLTQNIDYTSTTAGDRDDGAIEPHFGFNLQGAIGDTVFLDDGSGVGGIPNNCVQDGTEPGIGGISIALYVDLLSNGELTDGELVAGPVATTSTNPDGSYLFSGLDNTHYVASIASAGNYTYSAGCNDSDGVTGGEQQGTIPIAAGATDLTCDFGYRVAANTHSISGTVWENSNGDGVVDGGESRFENVTVELYLDANNDGTPDPGELQTTVATDANGDYTFIALTAGSQYIVVLTDSNGVLGGYDANYELTEGNTPPFNHQEIILALAADVADVNFGFAITPTVAVISALRSYVEQGQVVVQWETLLENGTVGFHLERLNPATGSYQRLNREVLPSLITFNHGGIYTFVDASAQAGTAYSYRLVELVSSGKETIYGPWQVTAMPGRVQQAATGSRVMAKYQRQIRPMAALQAKSGRLNRVTPAETGFKTDNLVVTSIFNKKRNRLKILVRKEGIHALRLDDLAIYFGVNVARLQRLVKRKRISMKNGRNSVPIALSADGQSLYFYGAEIDSIFTDENVYWLRIGRGRSFRTTDGQGPEADTSLVDYAFTVRAEENNSAATTINSDPLADYWYWDYVIGSADGSGADANKAFTITATAPAAAGEACLTAHYKGYYDDTNADPDHRLQLKINGTTVGDDAIWDGTATYEQQACFDQTLLVDGDNTIEVTAFKDSGVTYNVVYIDRFSLSYQREYLAVNNSAMVYGDDNSVITVKGFTSDAIQVFDLNSLRRPVLVDNTSIDQTDSGWQVSFVPGSGDTPYLVVTDAAWITDSSIVADQKSRLKRADNRADHIIIAPAILANAAAELAAYRTSTGTLSKMVLLQDIYDEFNYGIKDPRAIRDFLAYTRDNWLDAPRYVLLAGKGSFDYTDRMNRGTNLMPAMLADTPWGMFGSDTWYADLDDDGLAEFAIGRLPVLSDDELRTWTDKLMAYEAAGAAAWNFNILLAADNPDSGGNYDADSDLVSEEIPAAYAVAKAYLAQMTAAQMRTALVTGFGTTGLVNYIGHGSVLDLAHEKVLGLNDVYAMTNGTALPLFASMSCYVGYYQHPDYRSLGEVIMLQDGGGAIASFVPSGMSGNNDAVRIDTALVRILYADGNRIIGDAVQEAKEDYASGNHYRFMLEIYNLMGDPATRLH